MTSFITKPLVLTLLGCIAGNWMPVADAFGTSEPLSALLTKHATDIAGLKDATKTMLGDEALEELPYNNDVFFLRYCLEDKGVEELANTLAWRQGEGRELCDAAVAAYRQASAGERWDNAPIQQGAPTGDVIYEYITENNIFTTPSSRGDLLYCIRAGKIDDQALMSRVSPEEMVQFFLYSKEITALVANDRSLRDDRLGSVLTVNDLTGLKLIGGSDASFRKALGDSSGQASDLYPALGGPTLLLNLPRLLGALVKLFTPLFPESVRDKIRFGQGPLRDVADLASLAPGGADRESFLADIDGMVYDD